MAEWLRRGLQILARRFDSGSGLHFIWRMMALRQGCEAIMGRMGECRFSSVGRAHHS